MHLPDVRGWGETHSLDGPCWSLLQEYIANLIYALFGRKMTKIILWIIVIISGIILTAVCVSRGNIGTGWGYDTFWIAMVRMMYPFFAGLLLFRTGKTHSYTSGLHNLFFVFDPVVCIPTGQWTGWYEPACIIIGFPLIVAAGAGGQVSGRWAKICSFSGAISYPLYITHYPFIYIYTAWIATKKPAPATIIPVAIGLFVLFILLAWPR
ncbi:MAG: acyltransferase family protein [Puia sp.]